MSTKEVHLINYQLTMPIDPRSLARGGVRPSIPMSLSGTR